MPHSFGKQMCRGINCFVFPTSQRKHAKFTVTRRGNESDAEFFERYNLESVNRMLKAGVDPNSIEAKAALLSAVANGNDEISRRLINAGIRIDPVEGGKVLLATYDRTRMLELIKLGADVNAEITRGSGLTRETPLWNAVQNNDNMDLEVVEAMVKAGAHANKRIRTEAETTPFLETLNNNKNRLPIIKMFIAAGADAKDTYSQYLSFDEGDDKANTLILAGCQEPDSPELIKLLLDAGANPNYHYYDKPSDKNVSVLKYFKDRTCPYKNQVISILKQAGAK